jgi:outer membrane protein OmpA-like peptidoglycan-associated protein
VLNIPIGPRFSISGTFQPLFATSFADEALTDTSWGFSTGPNFNVRFTQHFGMGVFGRYNRLYQRVHGEGDPKYVTAGLSFTYYWPEGEPARALPPPPPPPAVAEAPPPVVRRKLVPRAVYFDFDKSNIRPDAEVTLNEAIRIIKEFGYTVVVCEGHTDSRGTDEYNQALSLRRASAVREYLIAGGIAGSAITIEGFGESRPVATNDTDDGRQQNRRVELRVSE